MSPGLRPHLHALPVLVGLLLCLGCGELLAQAAPAASGTATPAPVAAPAVTPAAPPAKLHIPSTLDAPATLTGPAAPLPVEAEVATKPADAPAGAEGGDKPEEGKTADVNLGTVHVEGRRNAFTDSDKRMKQLQDSLPCAGCDAKPHVKKKFISRVLNAVAERITPTEAPDHTNRDPNDKAQDFSQEGVCSAANMNGCISNNANP
jgi:hypothetical protein